MKINLKHLPVAINSIYLEQIPKPAAYGMNWRCVVMNAPKTFEATGVNENPTEAFNEALRNWNEHNYSQINY